MFLITEEYSHVTCFLNLSQRTHPTHTHSSILTEYNHPTTTHTQTHNRYTRVHPYIDHGRHRLLHPNLPLLFSSEHFRRYPSSSSIAAPSHPWAGTLLFFSTSSHDVHGRRVHCDSEKNPILPILLRTIKVQFSPSFSSRLLCRRIPQGDRGPPNVPIQFSKTEAEASRSTISLRHTATPLTLLYVTIAPPSLEHSIFHCTNILG